MRRKFWTEHKVERAPPKVLRRRDPPKRHGQRVVDVVDEGPVMSVGCGGM